MLPWRPSKFAKSILCAAMAAAGSMQAQALRPATAAVETETTRCPNDETRSDCHRLAGQGEQVNDAGVQSHNGHAMTINVTPTGRLPVYFGLGFTPLAWLVTASSDNAASPPNTAAGQSLPSLIDAEQVVGGSSINNGRNTINGFLDFKAATSPTNGYRYYVASHGYALAEVNDGGTAAAAHGVVEGVTGEARTLAAATHWYALIGGEFAIQADAGSQPQIKAMITGTEWPGDAVSASGVDTGLWLTANAGAVGLKTGIDINAYGGAAILKSSGTALHVSLNKIRNGIDFDSTSITGNVIQWNNSANYLNGAGGAKLGLVVTSAAFSSYGQSNGDVVYPYICDNADSSGAGCGLQFSLGGAYEGRVYASFNGSAWQTCVETDFSPGTPGLCVTSAAVRASVPVSAPAIVTVPVAFAALPKSPVPGERAAVNNTTRCAFMTAVNGSGSRFCPVVYTGSAWVGG